MSTTPVETRRLPPGLALRLGLAFAAFIFIGTNDGVGGVLLPSLEQHYALDKSGVSGLFIAGTTGYLLAAFVSGPLTRILGLRWFLTLGGVALAGGLGGAMLAPPWPVLLLLLGTVGLGVAVVDAGLNSYVAALPNNSARLNDLHAFYGGGALVGPLLASGILASGGAFNVVYGVLALAAAGLACTFAGIFAAPRPDGTAPPTPDEGGGGLGAVLRQPLIWLAAILLGVYVGSEITAGSWSYSYLTQSRGVDAVLAGWMVSGYWLGLTIGRIVLGRVAGRLGNAPVISGCALGTAAGLALLAWGPGPVAAGMGLVIAGFSLGPIFPTMIALAATFVPNRQLPSAIGFMASVAAVGGAVLPWLAGNLAATAGLPIIPPYAIVLSLIVLGLWGAFQWGLRREHGAAAG